MMTEAMRKLKLWHFCQHGSADTTSAILGALHVLCTANDRSLVAVREFVYAVAQGCSHAPAANVPFTADLQRTGDDTLFGKT
jgi:hypothetical protein